MKKVKVKKILDISLNQKNHTRSSFVIFNFKRFMTTICTERKDFNVNDKELRRFLKKLKFSYILATPETISLIDRDRENKNDKNENIAIFLDYLDSYVQYYNSFCPNATFLLK